MAGTAANDFQNGGSFYLDPNQQDLLLAALSSNGQNHNDIFAAGLGDKQTMNGQHFQFPADGIDPFAFTSPQQGTPANAFGGVGVEESPFGDYLDGDTNFDFDGAENGDLMIGDLPGTTPETPEKRKSPGDNEDDVEGGGKRREGEDKQAKKPGRKPLTSEPTTKRKAQNRDAQRAFRERKEKHLKDLETKVAELEKASDATNHENGLLRAQVQRLQVELREYRKRLSLNSTGISRSPPIGGFSSLFTNNSNNNAANSNFQFDFPRFGGLPGAHILDNGPLSKKNPSISSNSRSLSPKTSISSSAASPDKNGGSPAVNGRSGSTGNAGFAAYSNSPSTDISNPTRVFTFNSNSSTHSDSPSASSTSAVGQNSSCGTSPEPSHNSPGNGDTIADGYVCHGNSEGSAKTPAADFNGIDFFASQNGGQFDPALFGDYRDSQAAIVGDGDFTNGFFNEAFPVPDFGSPFHFGDTPAVQKPNPLEEIERLQDGEEEVVPGEDTSRMLNCHKIWDKLASRADFKDGTIDIDNLCSELRAKARCSESGVVVDHKDVEAALQRLPQETR